MHDLRVEIGSIRIDLVTEAFEYPYNTVYIIFLGSTDG